MIRGDRLMNGAVILIVLVFLNVLYAQTTEVVRKKYTRMQKLCSRRLSDALYIVCRERGYNEPFSYSNEDEPRADPGPGLVEECCYHMCTYEQLEQYCKPLPEDTRIDSRDDVMWVDVSVSFYVILYRYSCISAHLPFSFFLFLYKFYYNIIIYLRIERWGPQSFLSSSFSNFTSFLVYITKNHYTPNFMYFACPIFVCLVALFFFLIFVIIYYQII